MFPLPQGLSRCIQTLSKIYEFTCGHCHTSWGMQHTLHKLSTFAAEEKMKGGSLDICPAREYKKHRPLIHYMSLGWDGNWPSQAGKSFWTDLLCSKNFPLDRWTNQVDKKKKCKIRLTADQFVQCLTFNETRFFKNQKYM